MADYSYYFGKLAGLPMMAYVDDPQPGFYRDRDGMPVAYFPETTDPGDIPATEGGAVRGAKFLTRGPGERMTRADLSRDEAMRLWNWSCGSPVKESDWRRVVAGGEWHDEAPGLGHNRPEQEETVEQRAERLLKLANDWLTKHPEPIVTRDEADQVAHYVTDLRHAYGDLKDRKRDELAPYEAFILQIRARFDGAMTALETTGSKLKAKGQEYLNRQKALAEAEAARIKREEDARAAKQKAERLAAEKAGRPAPEPAPEPERPRPAPAAPKRLGGRGKAMVERTYYSATIVDYPKALAACADDEAVRDAVQTVANRRARAAMAGRREPDMLIMLPGTTLKTESRV